MDPIVKNLCLSLTILMPGMVTYGTLRIVILLTGFNAINFQKIDDSTILSLCVLFTVALLQQAVGISIEASLATFFRINKSKFKNAYELFCERFSCLARETLNEDVKRTIGQFFLSLNLTVGQILILIFLIFVENPEGTNTMNKPAWLFLIIEIVIIFAVIVTIFRCSNAIQVIRESE